MPMVAWQATIQNDIGNVIPNALVTVRNKSDNSLASIFDGDGVALPNPLESSSTGFVKFFAEPGSYTVVGAFNGVDTAEWDAYLLNQEFLDEKLAEAAASAAEAETAETGAVTAQGLAEAARDTTLLAASGLSDESSYATLAAAEADAGIEAGDRFRVRQDFGEGVYLYERTATGSTYLGVQLSGPRGFQRVVERVEAQRLPVPAGAVTSIWGHNALEWDGRFIPNETTDILPTLNLLPDPWNPKNESGTASPLRELNTADTTDPLSGDNALKITFGAQNQQLRTLPSSKTLPEDDYTLRVSYKSLDGGTAFRLGTTSEANSTGLVADGTWQTSSHVLAEYTSGLNVGISTSSGNTAAQLAIANYTIYDTLAGETLPSAADELAAMVAGHAKPPAAGRGSVTITQRGAIVIDGESISIPVDVDARTVDAFTMGGWINMTGPGSGVYGSAFSFDRDLDAAGMLGNASGQIGVHNVNTSSASSANLNGRFYGNPALGNIRNAANHNMQGQGWQHLSITIDNGQMVVYQNSIPIFIGNVGGWVPPVYSQFLMGAYNATRPRRKSDNIFPGEVQGMYFYERALSQSEISQLDRSGRERLRVYGDGVTSRKSLVIGGGDSLTVFVESYFWHLGENAGLDPHMHGLVEARGGSRLGDWTLPDRFGELKQMVKAGVDAGYDEVWISLLPGANDSAIRWDSDGDWQPWRDDLIANYVEPLKAIAPNVKVLILSMLPRPTGATSLDTEALRNGWNDWLRDNWETFADAFVDTGLGTERVDAAGNVTAETLPGGTPMGNYRTSQAAITNTRSPDATVSLSATSGANFTATAPAGTFTQADVWRRIVAGSGDALITDVNDDGSVATLSSDTVAPDGWDGEPAVLIARDTISYEAFDGTSYTSGNWSVERGKLYYKTDGLHPNYPGGRILGDLVVPTIQQINDQLTGAA